jgi:branched-chain amino acid transport system permease protein
MRSSSLIGWAIMLAGIIATLYSGSDYWLTIGMTIVIWTILAIGLNIMLGLAGYYHMGIGAFFGIGAYGAAILGVHHGWTIGGALVAMPLLSAVISAMIGPVVLRIRGLHFAVATLAIGMIVSDVTNNWVSMTGGPLGIAGVQRPSPISFAGLTLDPGLTAGMFLIGCIALILVTLAYSWFERTSFALVLRGIKSDDMQTRAFGYPTMRYKVIGFAISGAVAAVAGVLYAYFIQYVSPEPFTFAASSFQAFVIVAIGGPGSLWGPLLGSTLLTALPEVLNLQPQVRVIVYGAVLLIVIVFLPKGLASLATAGRDYKRRAEPVKVSEAAGVKAS